MNIRESYLEQKPSDPFRRYFRILLALALALAVVTVAGWGVWWYMTNRALEEEATFPTSDAGYDRRLSMTERSVQMGFEDMEMGLARVLMDFQAKPGQIREIQPFMRLGDDLWQPAQRVIRISSDYALSQVNQEVSRMAVRNGGAVVMAGENSRNGDMLLHVAFRETVTHELRVIRDKQIVRQTGQMAIILEDAGSDRGALLQQALEMDSPFTFGIVPWRGRVKETVDAVKRGKREIVIQIPMEPDDSRVSTGRKAILFSQSEEQNRKIAREAIELIPDAPGVTGYGGGKIYGNAFILRGALDEIREQNRFYVSRGSGGADMIRSLNRPALISWGSVDAVDNAERIALMLDMASFDALERGAAIVFAKITPGALMALRSRMGRLKLRGIEVVPVSALAAPPPPSVAP